jgi:hypothetical protein
MSKRLPASDVVRELGNVTMASARPSRRELILASAAACLPLPAVAQPSGPAFSDQETLDILQEEGEPLKGGVTARAVITAFWDELPPAQQPKLNWPSDDAAYDYRHLLAEANEDQAFALTPAALESYFDACGYSGAKGGDIVLFGLRGAALADGSDWAGFSATQQVKETRPDHIHAHCLIGVLDRSKHALALAEASTVPVADLMMAGAEGKIGCNMLPTGLHAYKVGPHKGKKQPGAFRQQRPLWVHRAKGDLVYALSDRNNVWDDDDGDLPMDDIHAAMLSYRPKPPYFSSAGCQVVKGAYSGANHQPVGPWAMFRQAAGLSQHVQVLDGKGRTHDDGRTFTYVLLTGKEARLVSAGRTGLIATRRFGASGAEVYRIQKALHVSPETGVFDRKTMGAVIGWQVHQGLPPTGVLTLHDIESLAS